MTSEDVWAAVPRYRKALVALAALGSLIGWFTFVVTWQVGGAIEVFVAPIALYGAVWTLVFAGGILLFGERIRSTRWPPSSPEAVGALAAGFWIARFPSPWVALLVVWGVTMCGDLFLFWNSDATDPEVPRVSWWKVCKRAATGSRWNVGGMLLGLGMGHLLGPRLF